jgi:hypothetical protein
MGLDAERVSAGRTPADHGAGNDMIGIRSAQYESAVQQEFLNFIPV